MPDLLKPSNNSRQNILVFLDTVKDSQIGQILADHLEDILAVGTQSSGADESRERFFEALLTIIQARIENDHED